MEITVDVLFGWIGAALWPFLRISGMFIAAPLFGAGNVSVRLRVVFAFWIALIVAPLLPPPPPVDPISLLGLVMAAREIVIGLAIGTLIQLVFSALTMAGTSIALSMGLGFASMVDPLDGVQVPVVSQIFVILSTLVFLALNGHLMLIELTVESFTTLPVGGGLGAEELWAVVNWGGRMFSGALLIALPAMISLLLINLALGIVNRAAQQFNVLSVGFPILKLAGFTILIVGLPLIAVQFTNLLAEAFMLISLILRG